MYGTYNFLATNIQQGSQIITIFKLSTLSRYKLHKVGMIAVWHDGLSVALLHIVYATNNHGSKLGEVIAATGCSNWYCCKLLFWTGGGGWWW